MAHTEETLTPLKIIRREKILDAAQQVFVQSGFRATTMEGIASAVCMSKATVYSYFSDKDDLFVAVAHRFAERLSEVVRQEMKIESSAAEAVARGLVAKYTMCYDAFRSSKFATELFAARSELIGELIVEMSSDVEAIVLNALCSDGLSKDEAQAKARLLTHATQGITDHAIDYDIAVEDIRALVKAVI